MDAKGFELLMQAKILGEGGGVAMDAEGFERLMAAKILGKGGGGKIKELEGVPPLTFTANGQPLIDYRIYGNTVQTGTPTPDNPIMPSGCGELETIGTHAGQYKLPILSNSTVTNIYLGESQATRRIKKLVLTGEENWNVSNRYFGSCYTFLNDTAPDAKPLSPIVCTHVDQQSGEYHYGQGRIDNNSLSLWLFGSSVSAETFKACLVAQYAAGTPVTVWYVLTEPETAVVNEPLMKIGDYADTVSMEQAGVSIPTNKGSTTLDVDTTIKPSNVYIKYRS